MTVGYAYINHNGEPDARTVAPTEREAYVNAIYVGSYGHMIVPTNAPEEVLHDALLNVTSGEGAIRPVTIEPLPMN